LIKLFGTEEPPRQTRLLTAGPLTVELDGGDLRYIRYDGHEAIRAVSYVVRDRYWGTFNAEITNFEVAESPEGFTVTYDAVCRDAGAEFRYAARIEGAADGSLTFEGRGAAAGDFLTNRTGFVVLHPVAGVTGAPVEVLHVDGRTVETTFPELIDPKQPIMDIRALTHQVSPGLEVTCRMEGDSFEMEDQRNWTDASYKTYVRPLGLPHPYSLADGEQLVQSVTLTFEGRPASAGTAAGGGPVTVRVGAGQGRLPDFAISLEPAHAAAALGHADSLGRLAPRFLSCYLDPRDVDVANAMADFKAVGDLFAVPLALEAVVPEGRDPGEALREIAAQAEAAGAGFESVAVSPAGDLDFIMPGTEWPDTREFDALYAAAREAFPEARLGGGNFVYFTELNRKPPPFANLDFVCHTTCAIVHAADDRSVTETIECLPYVIASGRGLFGGKEYRIGPSGMATRTSPFGADPAANPDNGRVTVTRQDPRQRGLLGAAWHLGYGARMAEGGVDKVILGAPVGEFGLVHHALDYRQPWYDEAGGVYPVYHVMRGLYAASGRARLATEVSAPREVQALAYRSDQGVDLWLANLTGESQTVSLDGLPGGRARLRVLDEASFDACAADPDGFAAGEADLPAGSLTLAPYAVVQLCVSG
jgi:hypothetical protein